MRGVKNSYSHEINFWPFVEKRTSEECWPWIGTKQPEGYGHVWRDGRPRGAHRISWEIANGKKPPDELWVLHRCDNPNCVNPKHLFIGTPKDNHRDQIEKGRRPINRAYSKHPERIPRGEKTTNATLTNVEILEIRKQYGFGQAQTVLAHMFRVDQSTISLIVNRKRWTHI